MSIQLDHVGCPLCDSVAKQLRHEFPPFGVYECCECAMVYLSPRYSKSDIARYYNDSYYSSDDAAKGGYESYGDQSTDLKKTYQKMYGLIRPLLSGKNRVLDIGCGYGFFLSIVRDEFNESVGVDISEDACARLDELGVTGICADFEELDTTGHREFDLIVMTDFIEHAYDLRACVTRLCDLAADNGVLAIVTPNYSSWLRQVSGKRWVSFKLPEHVNYFTPATLTSLLEASHFQILRHCSFGQYASLEFVSKRLSHLNPRLGEIFRRVAAGAGFLHRSFFVANGNMLMIARRKEGFR